MRQNLARIVLTGIFIAPLVLPASSARAADDELEVYGNVTLGVQTLDLDGEKRSKFEEYQDGLDDEVVVEDLEIRGSLGALFFGVEGRDLTQEDQSFLVEGGRYGQYKLRLKWDEIPHYFSTRGRFLGNAARADYWAVPNITQQMLEPDFPLGGNPANTPTATGMANLQDLLSQAPNVDLAIQREIGNVDLIYSLFRNFNVRAGYKHENREGHRAMSSGAYLRDRDGAFLFGGVGEQFTLYGYEYPAPTDYEIDEVNLGFDYRDEQWHMDFSYLFTSFKNEIGDVTWDNPLQFTGVDNSPGGSPINRLDLYPDSKSHSISLTAGVFDLPWKSKVTTTLSWGKVTQDDTFLPFTVNPALTVDQGAGPLGITVPLPATDLDGEVVTTLLNIAVTSRPLDALSLALKFNYYDYENKSDEIRWPDGWARIGEAVWSSNSNDNLFNRVPEYTRVRTEVRVSYKVNKQLTLRADFENESYDRNSYRNADTDEQTYGVGLTFSPNDWAMLRLSYHQSDRDIDGRYENDIGKGSASKASHEWDQLRMFDQADRERDDLDVFLSLDPTENLSLGLAFNYRDDEYDSKYYGLHDSSGYVAGIDLSYILSENVTLFAYYSREDYESEMLTRTKSDNTGGGSFAVPENDWRTDTDDTLDSFGAGISVNLEKLTFTLSADYSDANDQIHTTNTNFLAGTTTSSATAFNWPDLETTLAEVRADVDYNWTENLSIGLRYLYKDLDMDDFAWDNITSYGNPRDTQGSSVDYFIFMDGNYTDYNAHLLMMTISYSF